MQLKNPDVNQTGTINVWTKDILLMRHQRIHFALACLGTSLFNLAPAFFLKHLYTHTAVVLQGVWPLTSGSKVWGFNHQAARWVQAEPAISASYWQVSHTQHKLIRTLFCVCVHFSRDGHAWACFWCRPAGRTWKGDGETLERWPVGSQSEDRNCKRCFSDQVVFQTVCLIYLFIYTPEVLWLFVVFIATYVKS